MLILRHQELYPNVPIRPKMHFLLHLRKLVKKNGPMKFCWTMGFERLNGEIKRPCHIMNNFRNPQVHIRFSLSIVIEITKILFLKIGI